jgi:hypothetical protein
MEELRIPRRKDAHFEMAKVLSQRLMRAIDRASTIEDVTMWSAYELRRGFDPRKLRLYLADVEAGVERFGFQFRFSNQHNLPFPCMVFPEGPVAMDWVGGFGLNWSNVGPADLEFFLRLSERQLEEQNTQITGYPATKARIFFEEELVNFLSIRLRAQRSILRHFGYWKAISDKSPGLRFRVVTQRHGLRVHYTPSYFVSAWNVFGSPTSPVDGWIQPGRYKFGAMGANFPLRFDPGDFDIPPLREAHLVSV